MSVSFLDPETDLMDQFLGPETDIMGEGNFMKMGLDTTTTNFYATFRHARRLRFGMVTLLTNIRSSKVVWYDLDHP